MKKKLIALVLCTTICMGGVSSPAQAKKVSNKISLKKSKVTLTVGKTCKLKLKSASKKKVKKIVKWKSSNKKIATVTANGKVKAKKAGTAKITLTAKLKSGKKVKTVCKVTVKKKKNATPTKVPTVNDNSVATPSPLPLDPPATTVTKPAIVTEIKEARMIDETFELEELQSDISLPNVNFNEKVSNRCFASYSALQDYISNLQKMVELVETEGFSVKNLNLLIEILQHYDETYFEKNSLCIGSISSARGYDYALDKVTLTVSGDSSALTCYVEQKSNLKEDEAVTCDMIEILCIVELPSDGLSDSTTVDIESYLIDKPTNIEDSVIDGIQVSD